MSKARLVITSIEIEGRSVTDVAKAYGVSRSWIYELLARYRAEGDTAFEPRSRRPKTSPTAIPQPTIDLIIAIRKQLTEAGLDAGPDTIAWHLEHRHQFTVSVSTVARTLTRQGLVTPQPKKRPKASYIRFQAEQPNETWQSDFTHYQLLDGTDVEIITWLDDHSRYALHVSAHRASPAGSCSTPSAKPQASTAIRFRAHRQTPWSTPPDSPAAGAAATPGARAAAAEHRAKELSPQPPTTCGKAERFPQTLKNWLAAQPKQPPPPRNCKHSSIPSSTPTTTPDPSLPAAPRHPGHRLPSTTQAGPPADRSQDTHYRVLNDRVDHDGKLSLRLNGQMHHIGIGAETRPNPGPKLVDNLHVRVINAATGELLRQLTTIPAATTSPPAAPGPKPLNRTPEPIPVRPVQIS